MCPRSIQVVDSHTAGEPTRVVIAGGPALGAGTLAARLESFAPNMTASAPPSSTSRAAPTCSSARCSARRQTGTSSAAAGVIFFNNVGYLGMCGHGTIGLIVTLAHLGRIGPAQHRIETPVGVVTATLHDDGAVTVSNVPSYRHRQRSRGGRAGLRPRASATSPGAATGSSSSATTPGTRRRATVNALTAARWRSPPGARGRRASRGKDGAGDRPHRVLRPAETPRTTARTSSSAPARPTTVRPAAPAPAPSSPAWTPTANLRRARLGGRRASSAASSKARCAVDGRCR